MCLALQHPAGSSSWTSTAGFWSAGALASPEVAACSGADELFRIMLFSWRALSPPLTPTATADIRKGSEHDAPTLSVRWRNTLFRGFVWVPLEDGATGRASQYLAV
eukprot:scaffold57_cov254-Pinguiococcus_pyrenoidosus.AAC.35